ncbi:MAG: ATP-binding protein, partial [Limisphaerales bacterium]
PELHQQMQEQPRVAELLWFVQFVSLQPGGLGKFCQEFLNQNCSRIGTETMRKHGIGKQGRYTLEQTREILSEVPERNYDFGSFQLRQALLREFSAEELLDAISDQPTDREEVARQKSKLESELKALTCAQLADGCKIAADVDFHRYLAGLCSEGHPFSGTWYFPDAISALIETMDAWSKQASSAIAMTEVSNQVFDALNYALAERGMVEVIGDSRFGKTESIKAWCAMRPGVARLVAVPSSNSEIDLLKAIGAALGITYGLSPDTHQLKDRVEYVLRHSGLMLVLDEAHFLWPVRYSKTSAPARLNWVRTELADKRIPVALCYTPQAWKQVTDSFVRTTRYAMEQFAGRPLMKKVLPKELSKADLTAVAKIHFPDLDRDFLDWIVETARASEGYIATMEAIARRVRYNAKASGKSRITFADIEHAAGEVAPELVAPAVVADAPKKPKEAPVKRVLKTVTQPVNRAQTRQPIAVLEAPNTERFSATEAQAAVA